MITYAKISVTAKLAAYMRRFSDIPFAEDVAEVLQAREAFDNDAQLDAFLARLGLRGHVVSQLDTVAEIVSIGALQLPRESLERSRSALNLWILSPVNAL